MLLARLGYWASVFDPDCVRGPRLISGAVQVKIVAGLPAESPGSSQLVVGIDQSSRGYSECRARQATCVHFKLHFSVPATIASGAITTNTAAEFPDDSYASYYY